MSETTSSAPISNEPTVTLKKSDFDKMVHDITELTKERTDFMESYAVIQKVVDSLNLEVQDLKLKNEGLLKQVKEVNPAEEGFIANCIKRGF
jgi:hypothetical protein